MTQLTLNIEDKAILPHLKKILSAIDGVSIAPAKRKKMCATKDTESEKWIKELHELVNNVDRSVIDMNDERTKYIMSR